MTKKRTIKLILVLLLTYCTIDLYSQDTIRNASENSFDFVDSKYKNRKSALRVSLYTNAEDITFWDKRYHDDHTGYGILTNYEFKFAKAHSINSGAKAYITNNKYEHLSFFTSYRFYHNLNTRVKLGKTGENFAANYFFIEPSMSIVRAPYRLYHYSWDATKGEWALAYSKSVERIGSIWVGYGVQRNVFKNFNIDANMGFSIKERTFYKEHYGYLPYTFGGNNPYLGLGRNEHYFFVQISLGYIIR